MILSKPPAYRLLPGRLRITIDGLRRDAAFGRHLSRYLTAQPGVVFVEANALTGRALILFNEKQLKFSDICHLISVARSGYRRTENQKIAVPFQSVTPATYAAVTTGALTVIAVKRLVIGRSNMAASSAVFTLAALTTVVSGYPILRRAVDNLFKRGRVDSELILFLATVVLLIMRESITGLSVLWLVNATNFFRFFVDTRTKQAIGKLVNDSEQLTCPQERVTDDDARSDAVSRLVDEVAANRRQTPQLVWPVNAIVQTSLLLAAGFLLATRDLSRSLAIVLAGCPIAVAIAGTTVYSIATAQAARQGILIRQPRLIEQAGHTDKVIICDAGQYQNKSSADTVEEISRWRRTGHQVAVIAHKDDSRAALAAADIGIALRCSSPSLIRQADVVFTRDNPSQIVDLNRLGRKTEEVRKQNMRLALGANAAGVGLAAAKLLSPVSAGLLLNVSTAAVILNSLRILSWPKTRKNFGPSAVNEVAATMESLGQASSVSPREVWHIMDSADICRKLGTCDKTGLTASDAMNRLIRFGPNAMKEAPRPTFWQMFAAQFKDFMVQVLLGAVGISFLLGRARDALLTLTIVFANAVIGVAQERKATDSIAALQKLAAPQAKVIRGGRITRLSAQELVPGDVIMLEAGDRVPADARLITSSNFEVEEASLTGENLPVKKNPKFTGSADLGVGDKKNMVFMGTNVSRGRATAVVVATGMATEMGKIASLLTGQAQEQTPLQKRLEELGKYVVYGCLAIAGVVFGAGILRGELVLNMLQTAASLAVAAIPEGLSAIVIIALAMGVQRMSRRNIIVRKLSAIETLGCATVICSDKTGTLTKNEMTVRAVYTGGQMWEVSGEGYIPQGEYSLSGVVQTPANYGDLTQTLLIGSLCNNAKLRHETRAESKVVSLADHKKNGWYIDGDPTEGALVVAAAKAGFEQRQLEQSFIRVKEVPFDSDRRMMTVVCTQPGKGRTVYVKGAPDTVIHHCTHYMDGSKTMPLTNDDRERILAATEKMTAKALRVLACAYRDLGETEPLHSNELENNLIFAGLTGMIDPPRPEVPQAIAKCQQAGVKVIMITGDHPNTAKAIGRELGLINSSSRTMTGQELDRLSDSQLTDVVREVNVFARTSPHHKLRLIKALKDNGYVVAMTGDGVNDAPAVKAADIGIAMGMMGTDVTKEAASMTLTDDNFATIIRAMEEGRAIYANIRKAIRYLLATNIGEVIFMLLAALLGLPLPLLPLQLLFINLIGDGFPAIALVNDPPAPNIMDQPPRSADDSVFAGGLGRKVITRGVIIGVSSLAVFASVLASSGSLVLARTLALTQLALSQFIHIFDCRSEKQAGSVGITSNRWLLAAVALSLAMIGTVVYVPYLQSFFGTTGLSAGHWLYALGFAAGTSLVDTWVSKIVQKFFPDNTKPIVPCIPGPMLAL